MKKALITGREVDIRDSNLTLDLAGDQKVIGIERVSATSFIVWVVQYNPVPEL